MRPIALGCLLLVTALASDAAAAATLGPRLARAWSSLEPEATVLVWVDFTDKSETAGIVKSWVTPRSLARRARAVAGDPALAAEAARFAWEDAPVDAADLAALRTTGAHIRHPSRWFGGASVEATRAQLDMMRRLEAVRSMELVARARRRPEPSSLPRLAGPGYGASATQLAIIGADRLHDRGLYGLGVLVAHFDAGYARPTHRVWRTLRVAGAYDFVDGDDDPTDSRAIPGDALDHGHYTLSVLGGFAPGHLVGVAPGADYLLVRTESAILEEAFEEDHWIAAIEWVDSLGVDIVTSSLRFLDYMDGSGYTWEDMDGQTARVTRAADRAAARGILIFNGAGNEGSHPQHNTLVAPADAAGVIAVGAVSMGGFRAGFSSVGPTTDPPARTKPDIMAPGVDVVAADVLTDSTYTTVSGTSLSTPLAAGVGALLLSVQRASPVQVRQVLRSTASQATSPDNQMGWGIVNAEEAYHALVALFPAATSDGLPGRPVLRFANPFRAPGSIGWDANGAGPQVLRVYDVLGRRVREWRPAAASGSVLAWDGTDDAGRSLPQGVYWIELRAGPVAERTATSKLTLVR